MIIGLNSFLCRGNASVELKVVAHSPIVDVTAHLFHPSQKNYERVIETQQVYQESSLRCIEMLIFLSKL